MWDRRARPHLPQWDQMSALLGRAQQRDHSVRQHPVCSADCFPVHNHGRVDWSPLQCKWCWDSVCGQSESQGGGLLGPVRLQGCNGGTLSWERQPKDNTAPLKLAWGSGFWRLQGLMSRILTIGHRSLEGPQMQHHFSLCKCLDIILDFWIRKGYVIQKPTQIKDRVISLDVGKGSLPWGSPSPSPAIPLPVGWEVPGAKGMCLPRACAPLCRPCFELPGSWNSLPMARFHELACNSHMDLFVTHLRAKDIRGVAVDTNVARAWMYKLECPHICVEPLWQDRAMTKKRKGQDRAGSPHTLTQCRYPDSKFHPDLPNCKGRYICKVEAHSMFYLVTFSIFPRSMWSAFVLLP